MKYVEALDALERKAIFETSFLVAGDSTPYDVQRRLSDWTKAGKVTKLRRGLYALPKVHRPVEPHPFVIANHLVPGSYVSLEMALGYYGLIPEYVAVITNVTTGRPGKWQNEFGRFQFRHLKTEYFFGIEYRQLVDEQYAYIAYPEKALLDLLYLRRRGDSREFIQSLRLQNLDQLNVGRLYEFARRFAKPKLQRAAAIVAELVQAESQEFETL